MKRAIRILGIILMGAGIGIGAFVVYSGIEGNAQAAEAQDELFAQLTTTTSSTTTTTVVGEFTDDPTISAIIPPSYDIEAPPPDPGTPLGVLSFPTLEMEWVVVEGVGVEDLKLGPGHMPWTPMPGKEGNSVISGHRTTYGAPFHDLHLLEAGDPIIFEGTTYSVIETVIVSPNDVWVTEDRGEGKHLTLTTCNPIGSARERLIVFASGEGP